MIIRCYQLTKLEDNVEFYHESNDADNDVYDDDDDDEFEAESKITQ